MPTDPLAVYLNDHLAGSVGVLQLIDALAGLAKGSPTETALRALQAEIEQDQRTLREILVRIDAGEHRLKQAAAWVSEKVSEAKLTLANHDHPALGLLEGLEALGLGIHGKQGLWVVLAELARRDARLAGFDFAALQSRGAAQAAVVERERQAAARSAWAGAASAGTGAPGR